jgi:hypothetical protein|tara:strand:- start:602 stop:817 length:216 start_codon:yes stop_codon:yes gene_type:complete
MIYVELKSVGSVVDNKGVIYPMYADGDVDVENGVNWIDADDEWRRSLSEEDLTLFYCFMGIHRKIKRSILF